MKARFDTIIIGGGVAALWTANELKAAGHRIAVLTNTPLGSGQSLAAQGVIHGGLKYAIGGKLNDSSEALAAMPGRWQAAMRGEGTVDLSGVKVLSDYQLMWSLPNVVSKVVSFFGSKALRGRADGLDRSAFPPVFDTPEYKGQLFKIEEQVLDPVSIIRSLAAPLADDCYLGEVEILEKDGDIEALQIGQISLSADHYVLAAGAGNGGLLTAAGRTAPAMQIRPLHQLVIRKPDLPDFYSVCIGNTPKPPLVSTTHTDSKGRKIWYIGGDIAEADGVARSEADQIEAGKQLFAKVMPWVDLHDAEWFTVRADRAEPDVGTGDRPPGAFCEKSGNIITAWPTKLALAPDLADKVLALAGSPGLESPTEALPLPRPEIGRAPWELP